MFLTSQKGFSSGRVRDRLTGFLGLISLLWALAVLSGCAGTPDRFYIPKEIPIHAGTVLNPTFRVDNFVDIENAQTDDNWIQVGSETHDWLANLNRWTDTATHLLKTEIGKRGILATLNAPTVFELILCEDEETGVKGYLFTDVKGVGCPLDTDHDGVPDLLDQCPGTPPDVPVNRLGCPLDTDGDGSPDTKDNCPGPPINKKGAKENKAPVKKKGDSSPGVSASKSCMAETSRFTVTGPVPPDTVIQLIRLQLKKNQIVMSETAQNTFTFSATHEQWKKTMVPLELELGKRGIRLVDGPPRIIRLSVTFVELFWTFHDVGCRLNLAVETGDDRLRNYKVSNISPELYTSCDEAVSKAVAGMFMKERIIVDTDVDLVPDTRDECAETPRGVTVDKVGCPVDTDRDGVPDYLDKCPNTSEDIGVDAQGCPLDTDGDGVSDYRDECAETPKGVAVDRQGCPLDTDEDGVPDHVDQCPNTENGLAVDSKGCRKKPKNRYVLIPDLDGKVGKLEVSSEKGAQVLDKAFEATGLNRADEVPSTPQIMDEAEVRRIFKDALAAQPTPPVHFLLYFITGTTDLTPKSMDQMPRVLRTIQDRNSVDLTVSGHTDRAGSKGFNRRLSLDRARKVAEFLISKGVDPDIIEITSHGEGNPLVKTPDGVAETKNRRVEIVVR